MVTTLTYHKMYALDQLLKVQYKMSIRSCNIGADKIQSAKQLADQ
jgi:hypothetical protein